MSSQINQVCQTYKSIHWNVSFYPNFLTREESELLHLESERCFAKHNKIMNRRTNITFGDTDGMTYKVGFGPYAESKVTRTTIKYDNIPSLPKIKERIEALLKEKFPICAGLRYPNGLYGISRHRDREVPTGSTIAGLSVGEVRKLKISSWAGKPIEIDLTLGSLYVFHPPTNDKSMHSIETDPTKGKSRTSFTFRTNWTPD
jgi:hypothetical protein